MRSDDGGAQSTVLFTGCESGFTSISLFAISHANALAGISSSQGDEQLWSARFIPHTSHTAIWQRDLDTCKVQRAISRSHNGERGCGRIASVHSVFPCRYDRACTPKTKRRRTRSSIWYGRQKAYKRWRIGCQECAYCITGAETVGKEGALYHSGVLDGEAQVRHKNECEDESNHSDALQHCKDKILYSCIISFGILKQRVQKESTYSSDINLCRKKGVAASHGAQQVRGEEEEISKGARNASRADDTRFAAHLLQYDTSEDELSAISDSADVRRVLYTSVRPTSAPVPEARAAPLRASSRALEGGAATNDSGLTARAAVSACKQIRKSGGARQL
eukprot:IDg17381t1